VVNRLSGQRAEVELEAVFAVSLQDRLVKILQRLTEVKVGSLLHTAHQYT